MKMYPYIMEEEKDEFLDNKEHYIKNINNKEYMNFFKNFKKVWAKTNFIKFYNLNIDEFSKRTNNVCEWFHKKLNDTIGLKEEEKNNINEILSSIMNLLNNLDLEEKNNDENSEEGDSDDNLNNESDNDEDDENGNNDSLEEKKLYEDNIEVKKGKNNTIFLSY